MRRGTLRLLALVLALAPSGCRQILGLDDLVASGDGDAGDTGATEGTTTAASGSSGGGTGSSDEGTDSSTGGADCLVLGADLTDVLPPFASPEHVVDGSADDFCGVPAMALTLDGTTLVPAADEASADVIVRAAWSTVALHVFAEIRDAQVLPDPDRPYLGDAFEVFAASTNELDGAYDGTDDAGAVQVLGAWSEDGPIVAVYPEAAAAVFTDVQVTALSVDGGYVVEMSIPWRWPDRITIDAHIGFDLALDSATGATQFSQGLLCNAEVTDTSCSSGDPHPSCDDRTWCVVRLDRG